MKSPLRYPGGKAKIAPVLQAIMKANGLQGASYVEPYAGGAGAGLRLLGDELVDRIILNDSDPFIAAFWKMCLQRSDQFAQSIEDVPVTIGEWKKQRATYQSRGRASMERMGLAALFLNRCNRSGIISGGPIGGINQSGEWRLDVRFSKPMLCERIRTIAGYGDRITFEHQDALQLLKTVDQRFGEDGDTFAYLDPPYFKKADRLYLNHYSAGDHATLASYLTENATFPWVLTYDDQPEIRALYKTHAVYQFTLNYSAQSKRKGTELLVTSKELKIPAQLARDHCLKQIY